MIKLSDAIILGARLRPCDALSFISKDGSCALGAALEAVGSIQDGTRLFENAYQEVWRVWPWTKGRVAVEEWPKELGPIADAIFRIQSHDYASAMSLLTIHWQDRDRVAQWVRELEADHDAVLHDPAVCDLEDCATCAEHFKDLEAERQYDGRMD